MAVPVVRSRPPEAGPAAKGPLGLYLSDRSSHVITQPGDAVQQTFVLQQAHRPSAGPPGMAMLAAQPVMLGAGEPGGRTWLEIISRTIAAIRT
jgi:hypothetical protein